MDRGRGAALILATAVALWPASAASQLAWPGSDDRIPLGDLIEIVVLEDEFLAVDAESGGASTVRRLLGERVLWSGARGLLGVIVTDRRVLAIATRSASWREVAYERGERPPQGAHLGDRVALVVLARRALGFLGTASRFTEVRLGPQEHLQALAVGANVAVVVTTREAFGLSPDAGGFFPVRLQLRERIGEVVARSNLATIHTDQRVLVFRSPTGTWAERRN